MTPTHVLLFETDQREVECLLVGDWDELLKLYRARAKDMGAMLLFEPGPQLTNICSVGGDTVRLLPLSEGWWDRYGAGRARVLGRLETP